MPTGYTQMIKNGQVKTPQEFLHLCLRNFGVCVSMKEEPLDVRKDYTDNIMKFTQGDVDYHRERMKSAEERMQKILKMTDEELYQMYLKKYSETKVWCEDRIKEAHAVDEKYNEFSEAIGKWDCSPDYEPIKKFALDQLRVSMEGTDYYEKELAKIGDLSRESFQKNRDEFYNGLVSDTQWDINYHKDEMERAVKRQADTLAFYHSFKQELEKLNK